MTKIEARLSSQRQRMNLCSIEGTNIDNKWDCWLGCCSPPQCGPENLCVALPPSKQLNPGAIFPLIKLINIDCVIVKTTDANITVTLGCHDYFIRVANIGLIYFLSLYVTITDISSGKLTLFMINCGFVNVNYNCLFIVLM